jgi:hypothetical protein
MIENLDSNKHKTFRYQDKLPKLPIPLLEDTIKRYLSAVKHLQVKYYNVGTYFYFERA